MDKYIYTVYVNSRFLPSSRPIPVDSFNNLTDANVLMYKIADALGVKSDQVSTGLSEGCDGTFISCFSAKHSSAFFYVLKHSVDDKS